MAPDPRELDAYIAGRHHRLLRSAYLLCGDPHEADDLVQSTLVKVILARRRIDRIDSLDAYTRRTLYSTFISSRRRLWRREQPYGELPDRAGGAAGDIELGVLVRAALRQLPARQRAVLVLRFWEDLGVAETAQVLGIGQGTVKSHTARALASLRSTLGDALADEMLDEMGAAA
ncbi:SigE family RNA polymerase sigma factor [Kitasatospora sp. NPDC002040]|uniref:SigE family RNA polymerase sigma factor n=1 Tax=Kitasatospora sp. NPDC002040 TaxID=3154661 RepID=UPI0033285D41